MPGRLWSHFGEVRKHFRSIPTPKAELHVSVLVPKQVILNEQAALSVLVAAIAQTTTGNAIQQNSDEVASPHTNVIVRSFKASFFEHTRVRAGCHRMSGDKRIFVRKGSCLLPLLGTPSLDPGQSTGTRPDHGRAISVNLADIVDLAVPVAGLVPDFSTYNIARSHSLEILFKLEYENKRFEINLRNMPVRLLAPELERVDQTGPDQTEWPDIQSTGDGDGVWIVPPPSEWDLDYEDNAFDALLVEPPPRYSA